MSPRLMLLLALLLSSLPLAADPVTDLHAAIVPVTDQSAATRASALKDAMAQVLIKLSGSENVLATDAGQELLGSPDRYLQQYRYTPIDPPPADPDAARLALHAEFDGRALANRLREAGIPLWGRERPMTLAWIAINDDTNRDLLAADGARSETDALKRAAQRRGLPLELPQMDQQDVTRVSFMDVWGAFEEPLVEASRRYSPDAILVGSIFPAGDDLWAGRWTLLREDGRQRWEVSAPSAEAVVVAATDSLAERYASEFAVHATVDGGAGIAIEVAGIERLEGYAKVQDYLGGLSMVRSVRLLSVEGERLRLALELNGTIRALEQAIALGRTLEPVRAASQEVVVPLGEQSEVSPPAEPVLRYRYRQ